LAVFRASNIIANSNFPLNAALYANGDRMKYLSLLLIILISGCSSQPFSHQVADAIFEQTFEKVTNTDISYNASSCPSVKRNCSSGSYQEWYQKGGKKACACNK
jgi:hypothetical protein